eukprot:CAMPEP_0197023144 /NCGR_PEP_ID=MMETSP1384-20130603/3940_1 /TAXON_ID=29189 /ORGANISM="Ammonia sp." /LENGTH=77 /DNA_ID=CAMNT_0042451329 /DNA_START=64 /DNA_END=294 /DNA_ORIENTATION=-
MASTQSTTPAQTEAPTPTDNAPKGWIIVQQLVKEDAQLQVSVTNQHIFDTFTKHGFQMRIVNSRDIDIYLTNYERKS